jgi:hypothetical protein
MFYKRPAINFVYLLHTYHMTQLDSKVQLLIMMTTVATEE